MTRESCKKIPALVAFLLALVLMFHVPAHAQGPARRVLKKVAPQYPSVLRERGIAGIVRLKVKVRADGTVRDVEVEGGNPILAEASVRAVKMWRYSPGDGEATAEVFIHFGDGQEERDGSASPAPSASSAGEKP